MSNISFTTEPFYKLTSSEAKHLYKLGIFDAYAYVLMIIRSHGAAGWKWSFKVKDFCKEWEIPRRTFFRVVSRLKVLNLIHWEVSDRITVWYGSDIAMDATNHMSTNAVPQVALPSDSVGINAVSQVALPNNDASINAVPLMAPSVPLVTPTVSEVAPKKPEALVNSEFQKTPDFIQINFRSSSELDEEEFKIFNKREEVDQGDMVETKVISTPEAPATLVYKEELVEKPKDLDIDHFSAAPPPKNEAVDQELLKWLVEVKIPSLELEEPPRNLEAYARGMVRRDGDSLRAEFNEVLGDRQFQSRCADLTTKVEARADEWRKAGIPLTIFWDSSGMPAVMLDGSAIAANDFLIKPIEPPAIRQIPDAVRVNSENRKARQSRLKCAGMIGQCPGLEFLIECWGDILLQAQVKALIAKHPEWGISVEQLQKFLLE